ncbi:iron-sulfur cluster assembly scaffold protein [Xenorhabdus bovienii]|uniref:iron-sulfur cluster assembly scaffold protein n=1 Tax=Xenorhabdus bovienii TaxID=40576 RepID=UPI0020CA8DCC|nr:iron-sulfur cluster assembly scaffold protein [Xenorhabdus bovienii]MCP9269807.1 iron-sulfur cluster assembly scaffold protein [Xenorhabdus bovienii subsp. africana]MDE9495323.1 iron-sulfur cluster assembly scaffold protein [Xenorhabdus bovienii]MDE9503718.1 iron-sulfur cluster assembly scaffold protein [Xenorhabdus bovienii]MDE9527427.1 iron-sulfur cluster assembly scaffold protein [Xenorhabdus bovienii]MDE9570564.1 iron-sulfur cluster assembly scaffold protein [Xenorhabdus bovienii]
MFNEIITDNFCHPDCQGSLENPDIQLKLGNPVCGDKVNIDLSLNEEKRISDARFQAWGCTASLAMSNQFCRQIQGKTLTELAQLNTQEIDQMLGKLQPSQQHCLEMLHALFQQVRMHI